MDKRTHPGESVPGGEPVSHSGFWQEQLTPSGKVDAISRPHSKALCLQSSQQGRYGSSILVSKHMADSIAATQQGHGGSTGKGCWVRLRDQVAGPTLWCHIRLTHGKVWCGEVPRTHLTEILLIPLEKMLSGEEQAKQNSKTRV